MTAFIVFVAVSLLFSLVLFLQVCFHPRWAVKQVVHSKALWLLISLGSVFILGIPAVIVYHFRVGRDIVKADAAHLDDFFARRADRLTIRTEVRQEVERQQWRGP